MTIAAVTITSVNILTSFDCALKLDQLDKLFNACKIH